MDDLVLSSFKGRRACVNLYEYFAVLEYERWHPYVFVDSGRPVDFESEEDLFEEMSFQREIVCKLFYHEFVSDEFKQVLGMIREVPFLQDDVMGMAHPDSAHQMWQLKAERFPKFD